MYQWDQDSSSKENETSNTNKLEDQALLITQLDREQYCVIWDNSNLKYFQSRDSNIRDSVNQELNIKELEVLVPEKQQNLEVEDEK